MSPLFTPSYSPFLSNPHIPCDPSCSPSVSFGPCGYTAITPFPTSAPCYTCDVVDTIFLNCYLVGFSGKLGLGPTESSLNIELVERGINQPCSASPNCGPAVSCVPVTCTYDNCQYNGAIGNIYTFQVGNFCFRGILTNHQYSESSNGYRFNVTLTDGRQILSKTQVIVKGYYDDLPNVMKSNIINIAYKLQATLGDDSCGDGTKCTDFGRYNADQDSIYINSVIESLHGEYCQAPISGTCLQIDLSEIINLLNSSSIENLKHIKLDQNVYSVIDLVVTATENLGFDFYVEIIGNNIIFRLVDKSIQPTSNDLYTLLTDPALKDNASSREYGQELTFNPTKRMIIGENYTYLSVTDGGPTSSPIPSPSYCVRDLGYCYEFDPCGTGRLSVVCSPPIATLPCFPEPTVYPSCPILPISYSKCFTGSNPDKIWVQIPDVYIPGSSYYERINYGNIQGGPPNTFQTEAKYSDPIIIETNQNPLDSDFVTSSIFNKNVYYLYTVNNQYYVWNPIAPSPFPPGHPFYGTVGAMDSTSQPSTPIPSFSPGICNVCPTFSTQPLCDPLSDETTGQIYMYFGHEIDNQKINPRATDGDFVVYLAKGEDFIVEAHRSNGVSHWYSCQSLIDAGVLNPNFNNGRPYFVLSEAELLSTGSLDNWTRYSTLRSDDCGSFPSFGWLCMQNINYDIDARIRQTALFFYEINRGAAKIAQYSDQNSNPQNNSTIQDKINFISKEFIGDRLVLCYNWIRNIYDTYYGKQFLVKAGDYKPHKEMIEPPQLYPNSICLKTLTYNPIGQEILFDNYPSFPNVSGFSLPVVVSGNGESQGFIISDQVSQNGGFPTEDYLNTFSKTELLDLEYKTDIGTHFLNDDGNIDSFIKFGIIATSPVSSPVADMIKIKKFGKDFIVDSSILSSENAYIKLVINPNDSTKYNHILYIRSNVSDELIFLQDCAAPLPINCNQNWPTPALPIRTGDGGVYALLTIQNPVGLIPNTPLGVREGAMIFLNFRGELQDKAEDYISGSSTNNNVRFGAKEDISLLNISISNKISAMPAGAVIPLKSNVYSYGPYYFSASPTGSAEFVTESDLHPGSFNSKNFDPYESYSVMHLFGALFAKDGLNQLEKLETGTFTTHQLPSLSLGKFANNPVLVNDMNVNFGSGGFSTTYNFSTYSSRFGTPARHILDQYKTLNKANSLLNTRRKNDVKNTYNLNRKTNEQLKNRATSIGNLPRGVTVGEIPYKTKSTPNSILISGYHFEISYSQPPTLPYNNNTNVTNYPVDWTITFETLDSLICPNHTCPPATSQPAPSPSSSSSPCSSPFPTPCGYPIPCPMPSHSGNIYTISSFVESHDAHQIAYMQDTYGNLAMMSWDGIFLPVSLKGGKNQDGSYNKSIARFAYIEYPTPSGSPYVGRTSTVPKMPEFEYRCETQYALPIQQTYLTPTVSRVILKGWDDRKNGSNRGFLINTIAYGNNFDKFSNSSVIYADPDRQEADDFRFNALRGPLVIQAWGYDTTGKPIPNHADNPIYAEEGRFVNHHLTDRFMKNWLQNPRTWPVGPIDLRFDRERGVWVSPPSDRIVLGKLTTDLESGGMAKARLINVIVENMEFYSPNDLWDKDGRNIKLDILNTEFNVFDYIGLRGNTDSLVYAYWDGDKYIVLNVAECYDECMYGFTNLRNVENYKCRVKQVLGHKTDGCLIWLDTTTCCLCCDLGGTPIVVSNQQAGYLWDPVILDCPYADSPYPPNAAFELSAFEDLEGNWTFAINLYCEETPDLIIIDGGNNFYTTPEGLLVGSGEGIPIISAATTCLLGGTVDIIIDANGDATITINTQ